MTNLPIIPTFGEVASIFVDAAEEIARARRKHGEQTHLPIINHWTRHYFYAHQEHSYKRAYDDALERGNASWDLILLEEVFEALAAAQAGDLAEAREEMVQVVAMATSLVQIIDNRLAEQVDDSNALEV